MNADADLLCKEKNVLLANMEDVNLMEKVVLRCIVGIQKILVKRIINTLLSVVGEMNISIGSLIVIWKK